jgi:Putative metallopeptidase
MRWSMFSCSILLLSAQAVLAQSAPSSRVYVEPSQALVRQTVSVNAGQSLQYSFGLTRGTKLLTQFAVQGGLNNRVAVWLVDEPNYQRYAARQQFNYFRGTSGEVRGLGRYEFEVPSTGLYYVVVDNGRAWLMSRQVTIHLDAILPSPTPESLKQEEAFNQVYGLLKKAFIFTDFKISVKHCGVENAFSNPNITLCTELIDALQQKGYSQAMAFVLFHELGHTLLRGWGYPLWDNEDAADEFATVFMIMSHQQASALQAAQWWASQTSTADAVAKVWMDDRHTVSPQRARNIIRWLNSEDELTSRWMKLLVPNMQTGVVQSLLNDPQIHVDRELVLSELRKREATQASAQQ